MIYGGFLMWRIIVALIGAFGTAYLHEQKGRNIRTGGLIGMVVGFIGGIFFLMWLWIWIYYFTPSPIGTVYNSRQRWYQWWD